MTQVPVSFEFYPPKTDEQRAQLDRTAAKLKTQSPDYVSCTFGAGGSTLSYTPETVERLHHTHGLDAAPHISCVGGTRAELGELLQRYRSMGCRRIVARWRRFTAAVRLVLAIGLRSRHSDAACPRP